MAAGRPANLGRARLDGFYRRIVSPSQGVVLTVANIALSSANAKKSAKMRSVIGRSRETCRSYEHGRHNGGGTNADVRPVYGVILG
ncbi:unnamed protein product [Nesidiocoris tenuis]|uniref:Uncharacterized protein n=1 Tax=Nesidiocoris tenuis TaxID=355587 RepID=A0A6H5H8B9_9HEMI|nr:unnamed protein product [Nesidiocoris tenuis]